MTNSTKTARILRALQQGDSLTHHKAMAYGTYRLAAVVYRLRKQGYDIKANTHVDADGQTYTSYTL